MALDNLIQVSFSEEEQARIDAALSEIEAVLSGKVINLTPKQRQQHGRVAYEMETWVNKAYGHMQQSPQLVSSYIDMAEHSADLAAHQILNPRIGRMKTMLQSMDDTALLLGTDIYNNSIAFYRSLREAAKSNAPGATTIYADLKQQFTNGRKPGGKNDE